VAVIGDSTFFHSGITGLVDVIISGAATTLIILDNGTTAMTGGNTNPGSGRAVDGRPARRIDLETLCRALGVRDVQVLDAFDCAGIERQIRRALYSDEPSVLIMRFKCRVQERTQSPMVSRVEADQCRSCWACLTLACPALARREGRVEVVPSLCADCQVCNMVCPHDAIRRVEREKVAA
jgi:indolepyruvate ferredoxin oxidoreductase alpha subunit